jgi:hypothetical protein
MTFTSICRLYETFFYLMLVMDYPCYDVGVLLTMAPHPLLRNSVNNCSIFYEIRMSGKGRGDRKYLGSVAPLSGLQSDYVERALQSADAQHINYDPATPIVSTDPRTVVSNAY